MRVCHGPTSFHHMKLFVQFDVVCCNRIQFDRKCLQQVARHPNLMDNGLLWQFHMASFVLPLTNFFYVLNVQGHRAVVEPNFD